MADDEDIDNEEGGEEGGAPSGGGKKKLIILIVVALLVVGACVGGTLFMLGVFDSPEPEEIVAEEEVSEEPVIEKPKPAMYFPIKPAFVVNFQSRGRQRFLQTDITLLTRDPDVFTAFQTHLPLLKNRLVMLLGGSVYEELQTEEGRELMRQRALESVQQVMQEEIGKADVEQILFTNFVMQ